MADVNICNSEHVQRATAALLAMYPDGGTNQYEHPAGRLWGRREQDNPQQEPVAANVKSFLRLAQACFNHEMPPYEGSQASFLETWVNQFHDQPILHAQSRRRTQAIMTAAVHTMKLLPNQGPLSHHDRHITQPQFIHECETILDAVFPELLLAPTATPLATILAPRTPAPPLAL